MFATHNVLYPHWCSQVSQRTGHKGGISRVRHRDLEAGVLGHGTHDGGLSVVVTTPRPEGRREPERCATVRTIGIIRVQGRLNELSLGYLRLENPFDFYPCRETTHWFITILSRNLKSNRALDISQAHGFTAASSCPVLKLVDLIHWLNEWMTYQSTDIHTDIHSLN